MWCLLSAARRPCAISNQNSTSAAGVKGVRLSCSPFSDRMRSEAMPGSAAEPRRFVFSNALHSFTFSRRGMIIHASDQIACVMYKYSMSPNEEQKGELTGHRPLLSSTTKCSAGRSERSEGDPQPSGAVCVCIVNSGPFGLPYTTSIIRRNKRFPAKEAVESTEIAWSVSFTNHE